MATRCDDDGPAHLVVARQGVKRSSRRALCVRDGPPWVCVATPADGLPAATP